MKLAAVARNALTDRHARTRNGNSERDDRGALLAHALGPISGCYVNPAVTLGVLIAGKISIRDALSYDLTQFAGALAGAGVVYAVVSHRAGYS